MHYINYIEWKIPHLDIMFFFLGYYSGNTTLQYHDDSNDWPHYVYKTFVTEIPQRVEFDVQRTGKLIVYDFRKHMTDALEFEFCEIGIYGKSFIGEEMLKNIMVSFIFTFSLVFSLIHLSFH